MRDRSMGQPSRGIAPMYIGTLGLTMTVVLLTSPARGSGESPAPAKEPWLDAKSVCIFRLGAGPMPRAPDELSRALAAGWRGAIELRDPSKAVAIEGGTYPLISTLKIDLSDGELHPPTKRERIRVNNRIEQNLDVAHLQVLGEPLLLHQAKLNMSVTATDAQLALERDRRGRPVMMLADAKAGKLTFDVRQADLEALLLRNARETASRYGVRIESTRLRLIAETPRSLQASLHFSTIVGFIPAGVLFKAHLVVDDAMNAGITGLTVEGDEALGPLIVGLLRPALQSYNGKTRPLVGFPAAARLHLRDVALRVDDSLHLTAAFGS